MPFLKPRVCLPLFVLLLHWFFGCGWQIAAEVAGAAAAVEAALAAPPQAMPSLDSAVIVSSVCPLDVFTRLFKWL